LRGFYSGADEIRTSIEVTEEAHVWESGTDPNRDRPDSSVVKIVDAQAAASPAQPNNGPGFVQHPAIGIEPALKRR
jgi:hypothetical protein